MYYSVVQKYNISFTSLNPLISFESSKTEDIPDWTSLIGGVTMQKVHQTIMMCNGTHHFIAQLQCVGPSMVLVQSIEIKKFDISVNSSMCAGCLE